jgi:hypothetical protein
MLHNISEIIRRTAFLQTFRTHKINTAFRSLCYRHKPAQIAQMHAPFYLCFANTNLLLVDIEIQRPVQTVPDSRHRC